MYYKFNLKITDKSLQMLQEFVQRENNIGRNKINLDLAANYFDNNKDTEWNTDKIIQNAIKKKNSLSTIIDIDSLQDQFFNVQNKKYQFFISYSHEDQCFVDKFTYLLKKKYDIDSFVDAHVWGYIDDLISVLYKKLNPKNTESIVKNIYLLLSNALIDEIDKIPNFIFINSNKSIQDKYNTYSCWVNYELNVASKIERKRPKEYFFPQKALVNSQTRSRQNIYFEHKVKSNIESMYTIDVDKFLDLFESIGKQKFKDNKFQQNMWNFYSNVENLTVSYGK